MRLDGSSSRQLDSDVISYLGVHGVEIRFDEGDTILRMGEAGEALWVVLEGEVEVRLRSADGSHHTVTHHGPGEPFGEVALLRAAPTAVDVVAVAPTAVLRYPAEHVATALAECEPLRRSLLTRLADNLYHAASAAWGVLRGAQALSDLHLGSATADDMVAVSGVMRAVKARIERASAGRAPILVEGERGTGKLLTARMIHTASGRGGAPLIALDCRQLSRGDATRLLFGTAAAAALGDASDHFGALHLAHQGTLVLRGASALDPDTQLELARHLEAEREVVEVPFPDVRLVVTEDTDEGELGGDLLVDDLREQLDTVISLPPLTERRRDILPLARVFLRQVDDTGELDLAPSAEHALVSLTYRHRNVDELRSVVELAARVADGVELRAEHVFSGFDSERPIGLDLSRFWLVRWLVAGGGLRLARMAAAVSFGAIAALCLLAGASAVGRVANGLVWWVWEPVVFGLFLFVGSLWCTVCPLSSSGRFVQRVFSLGRPPPAWMLRAGAWISAAGFVLILWSEEVFGMVTTPFPSAVLLLGLVAAAVVCCVIWQREVWCRHMCPLGRLGVALAPVAPLTVAARRSLCASTCTTHDCYKGNQDEAGCPVFHHPQLVSEAHRCKTCLTCLRSCPHGSTGLYLRPRLRSAWRLVSAESYVIPFALTVFVLAPVLVVAQRGGRLADPLWLTVACVLAMAVAAVMNRALPLLVQGRGRSSALAASTACALLVLGWGPLMAYQMEHIPLLHSLSVVAAPGTLLARWPGPDLTAVTLARAAFVVFAAILSATILWNAHGESVHSGARVGVFGWLVVIAACTVYTFGCLWLVVV